MRSALGSTLPRLLAVAAASAVYSATGLGGSAAQAAVTIGEEQVIVDAGGSRAVVDRTPLRISFVDGAGRTVLKQIANERPAPMVQPPAPEPEPFGFENVRRPTLYAPFTFLVGREESVQHQPGIYAGNQLAGVEGGVLYAARDVIDVRPEGEGVRLEVATSDPTGRRLIVTIAPDREGALRVRVGFSSDAGIAAVSDAFASGPDEAFRGFGGRHNALDQRGGDFYNWIEQENQDSAGVPADKVPGSGGDRYLFPNGPTAAYYVQSLFLSSRPYGFLVDRPELTRFRLASDRPDAWQVSVAAKELDYVVAPGDAPQALKSLSRINGVHRQPPDWAMRHLMDRAVSAVTDTKASYEAKVRDDLKNIDRYDVDISAYRIEAWVGLDRPVLEDLIAEFKKRDIRVLAYFKAFVSTGATLFDENAEFKEAIEKGYFAKTPAGTPFLFHAPFFTDAAGLVDVTNPEAVAWYRQRVRDALDLGFDGFQEDFGEQSQYSMVFHNGETGRTFHNRYPVVYHRITREILDEYQREHPERELFTFVRSGFSGSPGSAHFEQANFPGDFNSTWTRSNGLPASAPDMLNRGLGGAVGYQADIGGYLDFTNPPTSKELLVRWVQWSALSPLLRLHNSTSNGTRPPWFFDDETVRLYQQAIELHNSAIPLIKKLWAEAEATGMPIARPLYLAYPGDAEAAKQDQQWLLGPDVLVAPVVEENARSRPVYFPRGCWQHPETGQRVEGPRSVRIPAALDELPYFFRCGTQPFRATRAGGAALPRRCASRRSFRIRLREPRGHERLVSARVTVNGRAVKVIKGRRLRAPVDLRGLPKGRFAVRVVARTNRGRTLVRTRSYRTCVPRTKRT